MGADGVSPAVVASIEETLANRELLKVRVLEGAPLSAKDAADRIAAAIDGAHVPQVIGRVVVVYRPHPESPEIRLPD